MKFGFDWPKGFRENTFENIGQIHVFSPGSGADNPLGYYFFINTIIQSI